MVPPTYRPKSGTDTQFTVWSVGERQIYIPRRFIEFWFHILRKDYLQISYNCMDRGVVCTQIRSIVATSVAIFIPYLCDILKGSIKEKTLGDKRETSTIHTPLGLCVCFQKGNLRWILDSFYMRWEITGINVWESSRTHIYPQIHKWSKMPQCELCLDMGWKLLFNLMSECHGKSRWQ